MIKVNCKICNKEFYVSSKRIEEDRGKYCSRKCFSIAWGKIMSSIRRKEKVKRICKNCNKIFYVLQTRIDDNRGKFCSLKCKQDFGHTKETCKRMSKVFKGRPAWNKGKYCPQFQGKNNGHWTGGRTIDKSGYVLIYVPQSHPYGRGRDKKYVLEHRLVMEKYLGHYLNPKEIVHHINRNRQDNRLENLMLFPNNKSHLAYHKSISLFHQKLFL